MFVNTDTPSTPQWIVSTRQIPWTALLEEFHMLRTCPPLKAPARDEGGPIPRKLRRHEYDRVPHSLRLRFPRRSLPTPRLIVPIRHLDSLLYPGAPNTSRQMEGVSLDTARLHHRDERYRLQWFLERIPPRHPGSFR